VVLLTVLCLARLAPAHAQELLRYEPPGVDDVYPLDVEVQGEREGDVRPLADAGVPGTSATTPDAGVSGLDAALPPGAPGVAPTRPDAARVAVPTPKSVAASANAGATASAGEYGAQALVDVPDPPGTHTISLKNARDLPGAFGDPLRTLDALPGVVPFASAVPYAYVRGAPPASQGYVYDDIPLPQLFHVGFGPAVIHPRAIGDIKFNAGVPSARYGRRAGGLLLAEQTPYSSNFDAEVELRLLDVGAWIQGGVGKGTLTASGRIGHPLSVIVAKAIGVIDPGTKINYLDGQLRYRYPLSNRDHAEVVYLGSYDAIRLPGVGGLPGAGATGLQFQRVETRLVHQLQRGEFGAALRYGLDRSALGSSLKVHASTLGPRFWTQLRFGQHSVRIGGDIYVSVGDVHNGGGTLGIPGGNLRIQLPNIASAPARSQGGLFVASDLRLSRRTHAELGLRLDYWSVQSRLNFAADPRLRGVFNWTDRFALHAAFGLAHQPSVFFLPLPGLTEVALDRGLTRSIQSEAGASYEFPQSIRLEVQGFLHQYTGLLLPELVMDADIENQPPLSNAIAYGLEFFLKRDIGEHLTGWVGYTLGYAEANAYRSIGKFRPDFDVRHVLNVVAQWHAWRGLALGGRLHARSGRVIEQLNPQYEQRLPWFVRADVRIGYAWRSRYADMTTYIEWLNVAARPEYLDADCLLGHCTATKAPPISLPNLGVRAEF
jgi:hypothetical protein